MLGEVIVIIKVAVVLTIIGTALFGGPALSWRAFRLLRWIRNWPKPQAPASGHSAMAAGTSGATDLPGGSPVSSSSRADCSQDGHRACRITNDYRHDHLRAPGPAGRHPSAVGKGVANLACPAIAPGPFLLQSRV